MWAFLGVFEQAWRPALHSSNSRFHPSRSLLDLPSYVCLAGKKRTISLFD